MSPSSFVSEDAAALFEPFATLSPTDSLLNRDLEKVCSTSYFSAAVLYSYGYLNSYGYWIPTGIMEMQVSQQVAKKQYDVKVAPTTMLPKELGNMYCASLYAGLATLVHNKSSSLVIVSVLF